MEENKKITIQTYEQDSFMVIEIKDNGKGISKEEQALIFERFYRIDTARNSEDKHYGLGLAIAKSIVTSHKGHIGVGCFDGFVEFRVLIPTI